MFKSRLLTAQLIVGALLASSMPMAANAGITVFNTLGPPVAAGPGSGSVGALGINYAGSLASSFSVGAGQTFNLTTVQLVLSGNRNNTGGGITVQLMNSTTGANPVPTGLPIATLGTLSDTLLSNTLSIHTFSALAPIHLNSGTRYWINVVETGSTTAEWSYQNDAVGIGAVGESSYNPLDGTWLNTLVGAQQASVKGVPEPATLALMSTGLIGLGASRSRRKTS